MAPHVGFDTEQIRDKARKDLLYLLESVRGKKNLVIERSLAGPVGVVVKVSTLQEYGVDKFFFLENNNADTSQRNVVFMARGECARHAQTIAEQIQRLQRESQTGHEFHIFWVPRRTLVSDKILEDTGVLGDVNIHELPLYFFPLERDVLSLELDDSFRDLFLSKDTTPAFLIAKALMNIQTKHGLFPRIIGKGDNAKRVATLLSRMRQEILAGDDASEAAKAGQTPSSSTESVIIIDREVDMVTPLLTQLTYEGLIDEVFGIQNNQTDIDSTIVGAPTQQPSQSTSNAPSANPPSRKRKIQLDSSDKLYDGLRDTNFAIVGTLLNKVARRLQSDYDSRHTSKTTAELKDFVKKLPGYQAEQQSLKIHTGLAEEIMKHTRTDQFSRLLEVQQNLAAGADPSSQFDAIEELIARDTPLPEVLRLVCIYSCISGGIKSKEFDYFRRLILEGYGYQHLLTLNNLEKLQLFLSRSSPMAGMIPMPGSGTATGTKTNYTYLRKQLRLIVDEVNEHDPNDIAYVYSGYAPLSIRLVQCILQKQYLLSITRSSGATGAGAVTNSGAQGWRGFDEAAKHARGPTFDEVQKGEDKAVKARALLSGGGDKKTVFVVFVGGITFTEIAALRFIAKKEEGAITSTPASPIRGFDMYSIDHTGHATSKNSPRTESEIIVRIDDMDYDMDSPASAPVIQDDSEHDLDQQKLVDSTLLGFQEGPRKSFTSSASAASDQSDLSSPPPSSSSKATTPVHVTELGERVKVPDTQNAPQSLPSSTKPTNSRRKYDVRPKVSIPTDMAPFDYANQCIAAAEHSRLNPYALHQEEYRMLRAHISHAQVTTYLNIRNGILRLWLSNPRIGVAREEAIGCAKDARWFDVANVCYDWLLRRGYINYGCAEVPNSYKRRTKSAARQKSKTVVVIGAGMSGLGCARQLEALFKQYAEQLDDLGEEAPKVIVLEGRSRLGGRVYSRSVNGGECQRLMDFKGQRHSVECGGMIITGFDRGNPLNVLVRGQMALPYYALRPETTLFDSNGKPVDPHRDLQVEKLFNNCLERVSDYKFKNPPSKLIEGNKALMDEGKDSTSEGHKTIAHVEEAAAALPLALPVAEQNLAPQVKLVPVSTDKATGKIHVEPGTPAALKAAYKARLMGWALKDGITEDRDLDLDTLAKSAEVTLGSLVDESISQYRHVVELTPQDYRLMNWHIANLEYSNATNLRNLSLGLWDIDAGNEWEGKHTMVVGGYQSVPWGLAQSPSKLDVRKDSAVKKITYDAAGSGAAKVQCEDGVEIAADYVVSTIPLGVLKHGNVEFDPPLPSWKTDAIGRLGFGILNKVILVYQQRFWDTSRDIFGVLRNPPSRHSLKQSEYSSQRGRFFQWFDVSNTSGVPVLLALMAGDAGFDTEYSKNDELIEEATQVLRGVYGGKVPQPIHAVVTRWGSDKFARGSYSSAAPSMKHDDYDTMARSVGNLFFAGEHTTVSHPATVHGAYLSGLRAATEVIDTMLGPIEIPTPLILPKESPLSTSASGLKRKLDGTPLSPKATKQARIEAHEIAAWQHIVSQIGDRPWRPQKVAGNAYLLYSKANFEAARKRCDEGRRLGKGKPGPNEVRIMTSKMWKEASSADKQPYEDQAAEQKRVYHEKLKEWEVTVKDWDSRAIAIRAKWEKDGNKLVLDDIPFDDQASQRRRGQKIGMYAESDGSDIEMES
ncbi:Lysine-specific histone demethylase 1A [Seiridium cupressi]